MVLKSLILQGFKSFPDRTEIKFLGGITAIVGPNGSGKSNISDAIRWVLGEQSSRSLRGAKMEDVIFGGTAKRGPVGFAEVSLILDNSAHVFRSEFTEIMVTRRYYRSGESEYFLNKKHCRLKDVQLIPQLQKPFRLVSLLLKRPEPVFQFAVQVADTHQIFLGG